MLTEEEIQKKYIDDQVEESTHLEYKRAASLGKNDDKKNEITKDVSAMANSDGGTLIYGIAEYSEPHKRHLPEKIDPVNRLDFRKEWLEHIIGNIKPAIPGVIIDPVSIGEDDTKVIYIVTVPRSHTAHQAQDLKYYFRYNFESKAMEDYMIRQTMFRSIHPQIEVAIEFDNRSRDTKVQNVYFSFKLLNNGDSVVHDYKVQIDIPYMGENVFSCNEPTHVDPRFGKIRVRRPGNNYVLVYNSISKLFPKDEIDIGKEFNAIFYVSSDTYDRIHYDLKRKDKDYTFEYEVYADTMPPKRNKLLIKDWIK